MYIHIHIYIYIFFLGNPKSQTICLTFRKTISLSLSPTRSLSLSLSHTHTHTHSHFPLAHTRVSTRVVAYTDLAQHLKSNIYIYKKVPAHPWKTLFLIFFFFSFFFFVVMKFVSNAGGHVLNRKSIGSSVDRNTRNQPRRPVVQPWLLLL